MRDIFEYLLTLAIVLGAAAYFFSGLAEHLIRLISLEGLK